MDDARQKAENNFWGYRNIIDQPNSIPEIIPEKKNNTIINVPNDLEKSRIDFSTLIDSVYYVKLETNNESIIGNIDKILFNSDKIIIVEKLNRGSILLFTDKGKFIKKIGKQGRGPGEYYTIRDVAIDKKNKSIIILDDFGKQLLFYDLEGNFLNYQKLLYYTTEFSILNDGSFLFYQIRSINLHLPSISEYNLIFAQPNQKITGVSLPYIYRDKFPKISLKSLNSFNVLGTRVLFNPPFTNTIYEISSNNKIDAKFSINLGQKDILTVVNNLTTNQELLNLLNTKNYYHFDGKFFESNNFLYFEIKQGGDCYYSKKTHSLFYGNSYGFDDSNKNILSIERPITANDDFFVSIILPYKITNVIQYRQLNDNLKELVKNLKAEDNPILFFYSFKSL